MEAIHGLWSEDLQTIWRSTDQRTVEGAAGGEQIPDGTQRFYPTVTYRCTLAVLNLNQRHPGWLSKTDREMLGRYVRTTVEHGPAVTNSVLDLDDQAGVSNPFTLSIYADTLVAACRWGETNDVDDLSEHDLLGRAVETALKVVSAMSGHEGSLRTHPFLMYHAAHAVSGVLSYTAGRGDPSIPSDSRREQLETFVQEATDTARRRVETLLARDALGRLAPSGAVALLFCAATLGIRGHGEDHAYILKALEVGFSAQDETGCWPLGRVVRVHEAPERSKIEISTYEISAVTAETLTALLRSGATAASPEQVGVFIPSTMRALAYAAASDVRLRDGSTPNRGWCSDHPYGSPLIESWTSANVLHLSSETYRLAEERDRAAVLTSFETVNPTDESWPSWLRWDAYKQTSEPDHDHPVLEYIERRIISPIRENPRGLPDPNDESVSALLFGPPGTSKTTIAKAVADALGWPLVMLSPGNFIQRGMEYIEAESREVFGRLMMLTRSVVLFDECDELFRDRKPSAEVEQTRGIAAFVTASMLPKLQELHDRGNVVFFICTNKFDTLDPAIKRSGRVDHIIGVGLPQNQARRTLVTDVLPHDYDPNLIDHFVKETNGFSRGEVLRAAKSIAARERPPNFAHGRDVIDRVTSAMKPSLNTSQEELKEFEEAQRKSSRPYVDTPPTATE